ncbi:Uncharacterised protein [Bordetella pertussis]|nr:Uncharacterised protein [Bordetella pertussis]
MPHLAQPRSGHDIAHPMMVIQDDARIAHRHIRIGRLHQLAARGMHGAGHVPALVLLLRAHIEQVNRSLAAGAQTLQFGRADRADPETAPHRRRALLRQRQRRRARLRGLARGLRFDLVAGQRPAHRAVAQREHRIRHPGIDQRLRPDDAARTARAVDHQGGVRIRREFRVAQYQFRARRAYRTRNRRPAVLGRRTAVHDHQRTARRHHLPQLVGRNRRRRATMLHILAKRLAGRVEPREQRQPQAGPGGRAALQPHGARVPQFLQPAPRALVQRVARARHHDRHVAARKQALHPQLQLRQRQVDRMEQVRRHRMRPLFARIHHRALRPAFQALPQPLRAHDLGHPHPHACMHAARPSSPASVQSIEAPACFTRSAQNATCSRTNGSNLPSDCGFAG